MKRLLSILSGPTEHRARAGWRLLIHLFVIVAITVARDAAVAAAGSAPVAMTIIYLLWLAGALGATSLLARHVDRRPFVDYGFALDRAWWADLGFGLALGALLMSGIFLSMRALGWITVTAVAITNSALPFVAALALRVVVFAAIAVVEEAAFRGYQLRNLAEGFRGTRTGARAAIVLALVGSSAFFGLTHASNANATALSTFTVLVAGLLLALPYLLTGELGISIGLHLTWNLFEGPVYGLPVSGNVQATRLLAIEQTGPAAWTGGAFGPEAGLMGLVWALVGCAALAGWIRWRRGELRLRTELAQYVPRATSARRTTA